MKILRIEVVTAPGCGKCARTKELLSKVIEDYEGVELKEVSVIELGERIVELGIMTTPAILFNGKLEFRGHPREEDLRKRIEDHLLER